MPLSLRRIAYTTFRCSRTLCRETRGTCGELPGCITMASLGGVNGAGRVEIGKRWPRSAAIVLNTFALFNVCSESGLAAPRAGVDSRVAVRPRRFHSSLTGAVDNLLRRHDRSHRFRVR
jgi:hypothetical protein